MIAQLSHSVGSAPKDVVIGQAVDALFSREG